MPWLAPALEGLASQTMGDFELLVLEDGSTDGTADFLAGWRDDRMRVIPTRGVGIADALNAGLREAKAPLVARHDADDLSVPERLALQTEYLRRTSHVGVVASIANYIDDAGRPVDNEWVQTIRRQQDVAITPDQIRELMPLTCCVAHGSVMARSALLRDAGGYRSSMAPAEDYDLWLRLLPHTSFAKLTDPLYWYRIHDGQVSAQARQAQLLKTLAAKFQYVRRICPRLPVSARLAVVGEGRGADAYRALAPDYGFAVVDGGSWTSESCDALVVANFADVEACGRALREKTGRDAVRIGNIFIWRRFVREERREGVPGDQGEAA